MKKIFCFAVLLSAAGSWVDAEVHLRVVQPYENASLPPVKESFVFGAVLPATATLTINGVPVTPHKNGGFLTMIPFQEGKFQILVVATDGVATSTVSRTVFVAESVNTLSMDNRKIFPISPRTRVVLRPGELMEVSFQGAPGGKASFRITGQGEPFPMEEEQGVVQGVYKGVYTIQRDDRFDNDDVVFNLKRRDGKKMSAKAEAKITVQHRKVPRIVELKEESVLFTGPGGDFGYSHFFVPGTRLEVRGEWGDFLRVYLDESNQGWIKKGAATELPPGTPPARSVSRNIRVTVTDTSTVVAIPLQYKHAHRVDQAVHPHRLKLTLYGVVADSDRIRYQERRSVVREIQWYQEAPEVCSLDIQTTQDHPWGYDVRYEGTTLLLEIRHRPPYAGGGNLKGIKIAVDAGHSKESFGTIGPWGNTEAAVNLMAAKVVKQELEKRGAQVVMIQDGTKEISLQERVALAWAERAHLFISIHADACGEGQNPRDLEGYSAHYFHPQSHDLAERIHAIYGARTGFRDQGLWRSNLAVCRMTQMPSVLFEQAFLILPEFEEILISSRHHRLVAETLISAITQFMNKAR